MSCMYVCVLEVKLVEAVLLHTHFMLMMHCDTFMHFCMHNYFFVAQDTVMNITSLYQTVYFFNFIPGYMYQIELFINIFFTITNHNVLSTHLHDMNVYNMKHDISSSTSLSAFFSFVQQFHHDAHRPRCTFHFYCSFSFFF